MLNALIIGYLFLGGLGAGAFFVLTAMNFFSPRGALVDASQTYFVPRASYKRLFGFGYLACMVVQLFGIFCLLFDVGRPDRILLFVTDPHFAVMSVGAYSLVLLIVCVSFLCAAWLGVFGVKLLYVRIAGAVGMVASAVVMIYTALLLQGFPTMYLWQSPFVLVLFVLSSLSTGIAYLYIIAKVTRAADEFTTVFRRLAYSDSALIVLELAALGLLVFVCYNDPASTAAAVNLVAGSLSEIFWVGLVVCGLIVPAVLNIVTAKNKLGAFEVVPPVLVLIGGLCLRICIVASVY